MTEYATFKLRMTGGLAEQHQFEAYDGFTSLAGAARTLTLAANYVETGAIRHRGDFVGRHAVRALPMSPGSLIADFAVVLNSNPAEVFGITGSAFAASRLLYGIVQRVIGRNIGFPHDSLNEETQQILEFRNGDIEALAGISESPLQRTHDVIGNGVHDIEWIGGFNSIANMNHATKEYMRTSIVEDVVITRDVTVTGFYGNSGHGSVWDDELGHNVPINMNKETLETYGSFFSWGLDQYVNHTGGKVRITFTRVTNIEGREKKYLILSADFSI